MYRRKCRQEAEEEERIVILMNPHKIKSLIRVEMHPGSDVNRSGGDEGGFEGRGDLDLSGHVQFGGVQIQQAVQSTEDQDRNDDGEITDQGTELEHIQGEQRRGEHGRRQLRYRYGGLDKGKGGVSAGISCRFVTIRNQLYPLSWTAFMLC